MGQQWGSTVTTTTASGKSVPEKRSVNIDQTIAACRSGLPTTVGRMGMKKVGHNSGIRPIYISYMFYEETSTQMFSDSKIHLAVYDVDIECKLQQAVC